MNHSIEWLNLCKSYCFRNVKFYYRKFGKKNYMKGGNCQAWMVQRPTIIMSQLWVAERLGRHWYLTHLLYLSQWKWAGKSFLPNVAKEYLSLLGVDNAWISSSSLQNGITHLCLFWDINILCHENGMSHPSFELCHMQRCFQ